MNHRKLSTVAVAPVHSIASARRSTVVIVIMDNENSDTSSDRNR